MCPQGPVEHLKALPCCVDVGSRQCRVVLRPVRLRRKEKHVTSTLNIPFTSQYSVQTTKIVDLLSVKTVLQQSFFQRLLAALVLLVVLSGETCAGLTKPHTSQVRMGNKRGDYYIILSLLVHTLISCSMNRVQ